ncbi:hypothetical protein [Salinirubrum litoreum]|uniref:Uncharacterized protein n=1 Tax=Salinirubrum litoreum TaxID=1126234 RepID=A0ABD5RA89_9EURY|nr:hypothetical protein [Salinirubrum litoreum]
MSETVEAEDGGTTDDETEAVDDLLGESDDDIFETVGEELAEE